MKKLITIGLAAAVLFTFAGQAKATALETSGEMRARAWWIDNYAANGKTTEWFDQRLRLNLVWPVAETVKVNVRADVLEGNWGTSVTSFGTAAAYDRAAISFDHVNMQFVWPGTPLAFQVGRQDVSFGAGLYAKADSRDRFKVSAKFSPELTLVFAYDKNVELFLSHDGPDRADDFRGWSVGAGGVVAGWTYGLSGAFAKDDRTPTAGKGESQYYVLNLYGAGKAGPVDLKIEGVYMTGDTQLTGKTAVDQSGIGAYASASVPAGPVTVALEGVYVSGNDPATAKNEGMFRADYQSPFWSIILYTNLDVPGYQAANNQLTSDQLGDFSVTNAMAGKLTVSMTPVKGLTFVLAGVYAQSLEDITVTTTPAVAAVPATLNIDGTIKAGKAAVPAVTKTAKSGSLGTEFDVLAIYAITDNVSFVGGVGYLVAGDVFGDVDNPMGVMGSLNVKF